MEQNKEPIKSEDFLLTAKRAAIEEYNLDSSDKHNVISFVKGAVWKRNKDADLLEALQVLTAYFAFMIKDPTFPAYKQAKEAIIKAGGSI